MLSRIRQLSFLDLADRFPSPTRERLRLAIISGEAIEFIEENHAGRRRWLLAVLDGTSYAVDIETPVREREAVCV